MPGGGNCRTPRSNSDAICASARRIVAVEAMTLGLLPWAAAQQVDRGLVEPRERAERPGNKMQLVLDDQFGWAIPGRSPLKRLMHESLQGMLANLSAVAMTSMGCRA